MKKMMLAALVALLCAAPALAQTGVGGFPQPGSPPTSLYTVLPGQYTYFLEQQDPSQSNYYQFSTTSTYPAGAPLSYSHTTPLGASATSSSVDNPFQISASATALENLGQLNPTPLFNGQHTSDFAIAETNVVFYLTVNGPAGTIVPVQLQALLQSTGALDVANNVGLWGQATGFAELTLNDNADEFAPNYYNFTNCAFQGCTYPTNVNINQTINFYANVPYQVQESVFVEAAALDGVTTPLSLTSTASADPHFSISPYYASLGYSFSTSPGLLSLTSVSVPEPATWAMFLVGFGAIGFMRRRSRRTNAIAAA